VFALTDAELSRGLVACSSGNFAAALLHACAALQAQRPDRQVNVTTPLDDSHCEVHLEAKKLPSAGVRETLWTVWDGPNIPSKHWCRPPVRPRIYLGASAAPSKVTALRSAGADITCRGHDVVEAEVEARRVAERDGAVYCSPYNDLKVLIRLRSVM
jgi:hypothetical protein